MYLEIKLVDLLATKITIIYFSIFEES